MSLRLLKILAPEGEQESIRELLEGHGARVTWSMPLEDGRVMIDVVLPAAGNEPVLDDLEDRFRGEEGFRLLFFPLEATVPRLPEPEEEEEDAEQDEAGEDGSAEAGSGRAGPIVGPEEEVGSKKIPARINREELYADLQESSRTNPYYLSMVALSSVVACAGLLMGDVAVIIGAMVIAPLIGPNIGIAFATTLGDLELGRRCLKTSFVGLVVAFVVALVAGVLFTVDPTGSEIVGRTRLTYGHLALALAAGSAAAIATAQGVGAGLVGVMVAVALLPPLANGGLLLGAGHVEPGIGALVLVVGNVVGLNLAATATFLVQGVRPNTWWEEDVRKRAVRIAALLWGLLLAALIAIVWFAWEGQLPG